jgi:hypothetical protein
MGLAAWLHYRTEEDSLSMDIALSLCQFITNSDPANLIPGLQLQKLISTRSCKINFHPELATAGSGNEVLHARFNFVLDDGVTECQSLGVVTSW